MAKDYFHAHVNRESSVRPDLNYHPVPSPSLYGFVSRQTSKMFDGRGGYFYSGTANVTAATGARMLMTRHIGAEDPMAVGLGLYLHDGTQIWQLAKQSLMPSLLDVIKRTPPETATDERASPKTYIRGKILRAGGAIAINRDLPLDQQTPKIRELVTSVTQGGGITNIFFEGTRIPEKDRVITDENKGGIDPNNIKAGAILHALASHASWIGGVGITGGLDGSLKPKDSPVVVMYGQMAELPQVDIEGLNPKEQFKRLKPLAREIGAEMCSQVIELQNQADAWYELIVAGSK